jgi:predicted nucleic acid-binding protein
MTRKRRRFTTDISSLLFADTWGWCVSANPREVQHQTVRQIMETTLQAKSHLIATNFILDETYTLVRFRVHHQVSIELHQKIERLIVGKLLKVIHITPELEDAAWRIFERYSDKDFSFTDCTSFAVMQLLGLTQALTNDHHFEQMGFHILP